MPPHRTQRGLNIIATSSRQRGARKNHLPTVPNNTNLVEFLDGVVDPADHEHATVFGNNDAFDIVLRQCRLAFGPWGPRRACGVRTSFGPITRAPGGRRVASSMRGVRLTQDPQYTVFAHGLHFPVVSTPAALDVAIIPGYF